MQIQTCTHIKTPTFVGRDSPFATADAVSGSELFKSEPDVSELYAEFKKFSMQPSYPCIAAVKAAAKGDLRLHVYPRFDDVAASAVLALDVHNYILEHMSNPNPYLTFVAVFREPKPLSEPDFEMQLWRQLQALHNLSGDFFSWDERAVSDPNHPNFCFSFAGQALFVVGLHNRSSRLSRRFRLPTLVFNLYSQFDELKRLGLYVPMQQTNRRRDIAFQGTINPMLVKFGEEAEAIQYSGREHQEFWACPFKHKATEPQ